MASLIKTLRLNELSLVDNPANPLAKAPIFKREEEKMDDMEKKIKDYMEKNGVSREEAMKMFDDMKKSQDDLKGKVEKLTKFLEAEGYEIKGDKITKATPIEYIEVDGEKISKADVPAKLLKKYETLQKEREEDLITKKAEETLPNFDQDAAKELLKFDLSDKVMEALKAADAAFESFMTEKGDTVVENDLSDPAEVLEKRLEEIMKADNVSKPKAYEELAKTAEGRRLINAQYKEKN
jgi:hypothetical protein